MKTAKAKGVSPIRAYLYHVLRPTMVPLSTTIVGQLLALFLGSSLLVETARLRRRGRRRGGAVLGVRYPV